MLVNRTPEDFSINIVDLRLDGKYVIVSHVSLFHKVINKFSCSNEYYVPVLYYRFVNNFGVLGILDRLHGTDAIFRASKQYQRHYMSLTLTPLRQVIPDKPKITSIKMNKSYVPETNEQ